MLTSTFSSVIMATGLMALVDDCIKMKWQNKKIHRITVPLTSKTVDLEYVGPVAFVQQFLGGNKRHSAEQPNNQPAYGNSITAF